MPTSRTDLITHPVRARILTALLGRRLTTTQIAELLPDVPTPSLYRHVRILTEAGVLAAVDEVRVNGAPSKVYAVREGQTRLSPEDVRDATKADHLRYLTTFLNQLAESFRTYLEREELDLGRCPLHCLVEPLHLSPEEYQVFKEELQAFLKPWRAKSPGGERRRVLFAHIVLPDVPDLPLS